MRTLLSRPAAIAVAVTLLLSSGLNDPRGLKFGPDGYLYVAEGGIGGSDSSGGTQSSRMNKRNRQPLIAHVFFISSVFVNFMR